MLGDREVVTVGKRQGIMIGGGQKNLPPLFFWMADNILFYT